MNVDAQFYVFCFDELESLLGGRRRNNELINNCGRMEIIHQVRSFKECKRTQQKLKLHPGLVSVSFEVIMALPHDA